MRTQSNLPLDKRQTREEDLIASAVTFCAPAPEDAAPVWRLIRSSPPLDLNSPYAYLLLCDDFSQTTVVARDGDEIVGCVTGFRLPKNPAVLFVWQVVVAASHRRQGLARRMIRDIVARPANADVCAIETTVSPSNEASREMFRALARELGAPFDTIGGFSEQLFPDIGHEEETRYRIGPFVRAADTQESSHA